jgi:hypothetical protein
MSVAPIQRTPRREYLAVIREPSIDDDFDISRIVGVIKRWRILALAVFGLCFGVTLLYALLAPRIYRAAIVVAPVTDNGRLGAGLNIGGAFGGLASLAGIRVGGDLGKRAEILTVLRSRQFVEGFIVENNLVPALFPQQWDPSRNAWRPDLEAIPTVTDAFLKFTRSVLRVAEDTETGLVTVGIESPDRLVVADWAKLLVARVNQQLKQAAIRESKASLAFLEGKLEGTDQFELRQAVYQLMEAQLNKQMLAEANEEFALRTVDGAMTPSELLYVRPKRMFIAFAGTIAGVLFALFAAFVLEAVFPSPRPGHAAR